MFKLNLKRAGIVAGLSLSLVAAGCGSDEGSEGNTSGDGSEGGSEKAAVGEQLDYTITGIDAGSGVVGAAKKSVKEYGLEGWEVQTSSGAAMTQKLGDAIEDEEPVIVTGWTPHWMFAKYDLKYLEDPKKVFGGEEQIKSMARQGLKEEKPNLYKILDQFNWEASDMESVMLEIENGTPEEEAAKNWIKENQDKVDEWTKGTEKVDGVEAKIAYVAWSSEIASANVIKAVLDEQGFDTTIKQLDNGVMWQAVAEGEADGMVAAWLPGTHGDLYDSYKDQLKDLGPNLKGAKIGLVVPKYMDISSIEDLKSE
ncbi:glycine betaine ABC transporter substrate-binding protein [Pontibacillus marinus]|uniref:Glycine/betaine ABC transporter n=1 Tax=Pontibacillus marinus BH030004 = DSM 16465 TaxID=1385511 RepID=A0A0A5HRB1_9BACI|nr:glycine betaine ABC transporter substrate-binding protein [Pontibacillus marinus]KGX86172.1 glycine/betaine ABC transporter [Pontibacillus marinus BH030004 = DSM 16465]